MAIKLEDKKAMVAELTEMVNNSVSAVAVDYRGLNVSAMTALRKTARDSGVSMRICRNTLARIAVKDTDFACLAEALVGPIALLFSQEEPGAAAQRQDGAGQDGPERFHGQVRSDPGR